MIFYDHDGEHTPDPGIVVLGQIEAEANALKAFDDGVEIKIETVS